MDKNRKVFVVVLLTLLLLPFSPLFAQQESEYDFEVIPYEAPVEVTEYEIPDLDAKEVLEDMLVTTRSQIEDDEIVNPLAVLAGLGVLLFIPILISLSSYIFLSLALAKIGKDLGYKEPWFAWLPILQMVMVMQLGEKSPWWLLVPFVGQIMTIIAIMRVTEKRGYDQLLGLIVLTGIGSYILFYLLAWKPKDDIASTTPTSEIETTEKPATS